MSLFDEWMAALEARHLADLEFREVSRALRALSSTYVERRSRLSEGAALGGEGKRAAFALFYGPLHYLLVREIVTALPGAPSIRGPLVDLGCGTGASGAAWAHACVLQPRIVGIDRNAWARREAAWTYRQCRLRARTLRGNIADQVPAIPQAGFLLAFTANEMDSASRDRLLARIIERSLEGSAVLVVEPIARFVAPWWPDWRARIEEAGGRGDEWRFRVKLPPIVAKLDRAAGLSHSELTGRSLWIPSGR
jgi:hypothetical protein